MLLEDKYSRQRNIATCRAARESTLSNAPSEIAQGVSIAAWLGLQRIQRIHEMFGFSTVNSFTLERFELALHAPVHSWCNSSLCSSHSEKKVCTW
jgi:hypothetical protein